MAETKDDIARDRDQLRAENDALRAQLTAVGGGRVAAAQHTFQLSEGARQELVQNGVVNVNGRMMTADEVRGVLGDDQEDIDLGDAKVPANLDQLRGGRPASTVRGVDFVYPSVAPGQIDPTVAGTPGINGPAAKPATAPVADDPVDDENA